MTPLKKLVDKITLPLFIALVFAYGFGYFLDFPMSTYVTDTHEVVISDQNVLFVFTRYNDLVPSAVVEDEYSPFWEKPDIRSNTKSFFPSFRDFASINQEIYVEDELQGEVSISRSFFDKTVTIQKKYSNPAELQVWGIRTFNPDLLMNFDPENMKTSLDGCIYTFDTENPYYGSYDEFSLILFEVVDGEINIDITRECH